MSLQEENDRLKAELAAIKAAPKPQNDRECQLCHKTVFFLPDHLRRVHE